jgi:hypothetical protein
MHGMAKVVSCRAVEVLLKLIGLSPVGIMFGMEWTRVSCSHEWSIGQRPFLPPPACHTPIALGSSGTVSFGGMLDAMTSFAEVPRDISAVSKPRGQAVYPYFS